MNRAWLRENWRIWLPYVVLTIGFVVVLVGYQNRGAQIQHVEGRVTKIELGNPCLEQGPDSALCQKSRNNFARTVTFSQACAIVRKANPTIDCLQLSGGGGSQSSPNTGSQLPGGRRAPRPSRSLRPDQQGHRVQLAP